MDPKIKREWVKALRSGEYRQGRNWLNRDGQMCCLGVLYDIAHDGYWIRSGRTHDTWAVEGEAPPGCGGRSKFIPEQLMGSTGLDRLLASDLAAMNDRGKSFKEIAQFIEKTT